jgi:hypothetical protein
LKQQLTQALFLFIDECDEVKITAQGLIRRIIDENGCLTFRKRINPVMNPLQRKRNAVRGISFARFQLLSDFRKIQSLQVGKG